MRFELQPHSTTVPSPPFTLWASAERSAAFGETATLNLWFGISAPMNRFLVPEVASEPACATSCAGDLDPATWKS